MDAAAVARAEGGAVLLEGVAVGGFAGAGGAGHQLDGAATHGEDGVLCDGK